MPRTKHSNEYERAILQNIARYGWHATSVFGEPDSPSSTYTIGLFHSFGFPELIVLGLPARTAHGILSLAASAAEAGKPFDLDRPTDALLRGYSAVFVRVPIREYDGYVLSSLWYYEGSDFPLYQVVWPFEDGRFPWHGSVPAALRRTQPVLGAYAGGA